MQFRSLTPAEADKFRQWAIDNYVPFTDINGTWHPVTQLQCVTINFNHSTWTMDEDHDNG